MSKSTRRDFLCTSAASAAAASLAPGWLAAAPQRSNSPSETLGCAVIGVNGRGSNHISEWIKDSRSEILYIVEVDEKVGNQRCDQIEQKQGRRPKLVADMRRAFDDSSVDFISTATPNHWHALCGVWAMQAGKDAYIEKPISHNVAEGQSLIAAAEKYGRMVQVGTQCRSSKAVIDAMNFIKEGGIGECNLARGLCYKRRKSIGQLGDYPIPNDVDFNLWSGPATYTSPKLTRPQFHYDWHWQRHYGNGDSGNQGPHQTDIARWGLGVDRQPNSIISYGGRLGYKAERNDPNYVDAGDTANTQVSIYDYGDKTLVFETRGLSVDNSADDEINRLFPNERGNKIGVIFYGTDGYVVQASYTHCIAYDKDMNIIKEFKGDGEHFANFLDAVQSRDASQLNSDARVGHLSACVAHLGNISYYVGEENKVSVAEGRQAIEKVASRDNDVETYDRTIQHLRDNGVDVERYQISLGPQLAFDPESETFQNSSAANEMLTREYRDGFVCPSKDQV